MDFKRLAAMRELHEERTAMKHSRFKTRQDLEQARQNERTLVDNETVKRLQTCTDEYSLKASEMKDHFDAACKELEKNKERELSLIESETFNQHIEDDKRHVAQMASWEATCDLDEHENDKRFSELLAENGNSASVAESSTRNGKATGREVYPDTIFVQATPTKRHNALEERSESPEIPLSQSRLTQSTLATTSRQDAPMEERSESPEIPLSQSRLKNSTSRTASHNEQEEFKLVLSDCGTVYVSPACMRDVPVAKICDNSPYWEDSWETYSSLMRSIDHRITELEEKRRKKLEEMKKILPGQQNLHEAQKELYDLEAKHSDRRKTRVNIQCVIEYFRDCCIHPNQLLSKEYIVLNGLLVHKTLSVLKVLLIKVEKASHLGATDGIDPITYLRKLLYQQIKNQEAAGRKFSLKEYLKRMGESYDIEQMQARADEAQKMSEQTAKPDIARPSDCRSDYAISGAPVHPQTANRTASTIDFAPSVHASASQISVSAQKRKVFEGSTFSQSDRQRQQPRYDLKSASKRQHSISAHGMPADSTRLLPVTGNNSLASYTAPTTEQFPAPSIATADLPSSVNADPAGLTKASGSLFAT